MSFNSNPLNPATLTLWQAHDRLCLCGSVPLIWPLSRKMSMEPGRLQTKSPPLWDLCFLQQLTCIFQHRPWYPNLPGRVADAQNRSKQHFVPDDAIVSRLSRQWKGQWQCQVFPVSLVARCCDSCDGGFLRKAIFIAYGNQWVVASALLESCEQSVKIMNACWSPRMYALSKTSCSLELGWHQWLQLSLVLVMSARWVLSCFVCFA